MALFSKNRDEFSYIYGNFHKDRSDFSFISAEAVFLQYQHVMVMYSDLLFVIINT